MEYKREDDKMDKKLIFRYIMLIVGVSIMSLGISLSIKATLGTAPISSVPYVLCIIFPLSVGVFTILFNALLVLFQMLLLKKVTVSQIAQMLVCILFGYMIDFTLGLLSFINLTDYISQWILCIVSCFVLAFGLTIEVKSNLTMLPGDGAVLAIAEVLNRDFGKVKPFFDISIITMAAVISFIFLGHLEGVREGTIFAGIVVGFIIQFYDNIFGKKIDEYLED